MIYRKLDENGDFTFGLGSGNFLKDSEAVGQAIKTRLGLLLAEWWEDIEDGFPLFQAVLGKPSSNSYIFAANSAILERVARTDGVAKLNEYNFDWDSNARKISYTISVTTDYSETITYTGANQL